MFTHSFLGNTHFDLQVTCLLPSFSHNLKCPQTVVQMYSTTRADAQCGLADLFQPDSVGDCLMAQEAICFILWAICYKTHW